MKRIISSSLVTLSLLSGLSGALVTVNADSTTSDKMQTVQLNNKVNDLSSFSFTKMGLYNNYILSTPLADGVVGNSLTNDSTKIEFSSLSSDVVEVGLSTSLSNDSSLTESKATNGKATLDISGLKDVQDSSALIYVKTANDPDTMVAVGMLNQEYSNFEYNKEEGIDFFMHPDTLKANNTKNGKITNKTTKLTFTSRAIPKDFDATRWALTEFQGHHETMSVTMIKDDAEHEVTIEVPEGFFTPDSEKEDVYSFYAEGENSTTEDYDIFNIDKSQIEIVK